MTGNTSNISEMASHERLPMLANSDDEEDETNSGLVEGAENLKIYRSEDQGYKSPMVSTKSVKELQDIMNIFQRCKLGFPPLFSD